MMSTYKSITIGTTNTHKYQRLKAVLEEINPEIVVKPLGALQAEPPQENGNDEYENALIKGRYYSQFVNGPILAEDDGIYLDGLNDFDQPGIHVHRIFKDGKEKSNKEVFEYWQDLLRHKNYTGHIKKVFVLLDNINIITEEVLIKVVFKALDSDLTEKISDNPLNYFMIPQGFHKSFQDMDKREITVYNLDIKKAIKNLLFNYERSERGRSKKERASSIR